MTKKPDKRKDFPINKAFEYCLKVLNGEIAFEGSIKDLEKVIKDEFKFPEGREKLLVKRAVEEYNLQKKNSETEVKPEIPKIETTPLDFQWKLKKNDLEILKSIHEYQFRNLAFEKSNIPKSSFYRRFKLMVKNNILIEIKGDQKGQLSRFIINPAFIDNFLPANVLPQYKSQFSLVRSGDKNRVSLFEETQNDETSQNQPEIKDFEKEATSQIPFNDPHVRENFETSLSKLIKKIENWNPNSYTIDIRKIRTHSLIENLTIAKKPNNLEQLLENSQYFTVIPRMKNWKPFHNKGTLGTLSKLELKAYIRFNIDVVTIAIPEIVGPDARYNSMKGLQQILEIKAMLENEFSGLELIPNLQFGLTRIKSPEHAVISGLPALQRLALESRQMKVYLKGDNIMIDESPGKPEAEFIDRVHSTTHIMKEFQRYDWSAENGIYLNDVYEDLQNYKQQNQIIENKILKRLQEVEDNLDVKIELESLQTQIEIEKLRNEQLRFESSLIPFIQGLHNEREKNEKGLLDILMKQATTLENQQRTLNLLLEKIFKKSIIERVFSKLKVERR